jgi:hypothetical protein
MVFKALGLFSVSKRTWSMGKVTLSWSEWAGGSIVVLAARHEPGRNNLEHSGGNAADRTAGPVGKIRFASDDTEAFVTTSQLCSLVVA